MLIAVDEWRDGGEAYDFRIFHPSAVPVTKKVGSNEPCPCGSGKKYKKCCGISKG